MNDKRKVREFLSYAEKYMSFVLFVCIGSFFVASMLSAVIDSDFYSLFIILFLATTISPLICIGLVTLIEKLIKIINKEKQ
ncbi:hypothetical protein GNO33_08790 [Campylobacter jejuni]|uniref:hypothetical protein n=1 Tax=Campylobacter TaxID=194 RepID=UPI000F8080B8|nr:MULTISPECIES: hypothetical protein [Campylobacter]ECH3398250.1 hypothetical protein [Campylobacter jejuni]ECH3658263.1 hypothetical protein [Campylobacter jejuni]ECP9228213.1 hypothetical protein [Campylobacter jejuni]ECP9363935.1 hypothetical protein [Campylobacter jejuni]EDO7567923.1 hypothetical protein [Campylobacter jejuni]